MNSNFLNKDGKRDKRIELFIIVTIVVSIIIIFMKPSHNSTTEDYSLVEQQRTVALENALFNAQTYRASNPRFSEGFSIVPHTDETISPECIQGDGWANLSIMKQQDKTVEKYKVICSTVSPTLGCYLENDFKSRNFFSEEGVCQPNKVPKQLKKIAK